MNDINTCINDYAHVIVKTLRPTDPESWNTNEIFVRLMLRKFVEKITIKNEIDEQDQSDINALGKFDDGGK